MTTLMGILAVVALIAGGASLVLAIVTILFARATERDNRANYEKTQEVMASQHARTKELLAEIDKRATVTEKTVLDAQHKLLNTVTTIVNETVLPKKQDMGEQFGLAFMQMMMQDPTKAAEVLGKMMPLIERMKKSEDESS